MAFPIYQGAVMGHAAVKPNQDHSAITNKSVRSTAPSCHIIFCLFFCCLKISIISTVTASWIFIFQPLPFFCISLSSFLILLNSPQIDYSFCLVPFLVICLPSWAALLAKTAINWFASLSPSLLFGIQMQLRYYTPHPLKSMCVCV